MKSLVEYLNDMTMSQNMHPIGQRMSEIVDQANVFYQFEGIPSDIHQDILDNKFPDIVHENLSSHDWRKLADKMIEEFPEYFDEVVFHGTIPKSSFGIRVKDIKDIDKISKDNDLNALLDFFNYYFTQTSNNKEDVMLYEPKYSVKMNDKLKNAKFAYHVTSNRDYAKIRSIFSHGLKPMHGSYQNYPDRIYMYVPLKDDDYKSTIEGIRELVGFKNYDFDEVTIFQIDLKKWNGDMYHDTAMDDDRCVFTYSEINKNAIKEVTEKFKNNL